MENEIDQLKWDIYSIHEHKLPEDIGICIDCEHFYKRLKEQGYTRPPQEQYMTNMVKDKNGNVVNVEKVEISQEQVCPYCKGDPKECACVPGISSKPSQKQASHKEFSGYTYEPNKLDWDKPAPSVEDSLAELEEAFLGGDYTEKEILKYIRNIRQLLRGEKV